MAVLNQFTTRRLLAPVALLAVAGVLAGLLASAGAGPVREALPRALAWVQTLGPWGPVALAALYVVACVLLVPGSVLTLGAGFLFGIPVGAVTVSVGSTLGAAAAFLVGRTLARPWVERKVAGNPKFHAIDRAVRAQGFKVVLLVRLSPVFPFNLMNYAFGLTGVRFRDYFLASWVGMLPGVFLYVYLGSAVRNLAELTGGQVEGGSAQKVFLFAGLAATVVATVFITRVARRALDRAIPQDRPPTAAARAGAPAGSEP
jgi:uncharacterized membrane protein YdjX (TVP38/TMEM64 family)